MALSLRAREAIALTTVVLLVVAVATAAHVTSVAQITLRGAADEGDLLARQLFHQSAQVIAASRTPSVDSLRPDPSVRALLEGMVGYSHVVVYAAVVDPAGRIVVHSDPALEGRTLAPQPRLSAVLGWSAPRMVLALLGEPQMYEARLPLRLGDRPFGTVRVGISTSLVRQEIRNALVRSIALGAVAIVAAVAVGLGAGRVLLQSLRRIARRMERLARGDFGTNVELARTDDMGALAEQVNRLGERIQPDLGPAPSEPARAEATARRLEDAVVFLNGEREVIFCNQAAGRLLSLPVGSAARKPLAALVPAGHPLLEVEAELFGSARGTRRQPLTIEEPGGAPRDLAVSSYLIETDGRLAGGVLVLQDLEPVRAVESLVTYSQKLAALGRLTSGVAHEVKNPLNAMRIHLELLKTRLPGDRPDIADSLDVLAQEIQRLDRVVQGFLKFMRPQDLHLAPVDPNALAGDVARLAAPEASEAGVDVLLDLAPDLPPVSGDAELLQQALTNLVTNAVQAMPKGGTLTVATRLGPPGAVEVRVIDQGVGIAPEDLDRIFRLYYSTKERGSGIGLSLVYRIVQMHDARIDVESTVGEGTTMTLTLPLAQPPAPA